jgi:membrane-associated phospholipid phosphatase
VFIDTQRYLSQLRGLATVLWAIVGLMYLAVAVPDTRAWIQTIDDQFFTLVVDREASSAVSIAELLSFLGSWKIMFPFVMIVAAFLYWTRRRPATLSWLAALAVSGVLIWASKVIYARPRPPMALVTTQSYSFPSGHAGTAATAAIGVVLLFVLLESRHWSFEVLAIAYVIAISWSRVYLRAHWLSDVITGAALGAAIVISTLLIVSSLVGQGWLPDDGLTDRGD